MSVDYFGPLTVTPWGNSHILLFTDRFSRRADMYAVSAAEFTAEGTADILANKYIPLWGCPSSLSDNGLQFCSKPSLAVYKLLVVRKVATSAYHPNGNGGVERVKHTMAQMLAMVVNERQDNLDVHLPHVEFAYNNSVSTATGLAPNEAPMNRLPAFPSPSSNTTTPGATKASPATTWNTANSPPTANGVSMRWFANNTPSLSPAWSAVIQRSPTHSNNSLSTPSAAGYGSTTPLLPSGGVPNPAQTPRFSRRIYRLTGRALSIS